MEKNTQNTALLVMDMHGILRSFPGAAPLTAKVATAIAFARKKSIPVIYVIVAFRPGTPEISINNKAFTTNKEMFTGVDMDEFMKIDPAIAPMPDEVITIKRRVSAFTGSDLEVVLRAKGIQHIVLTGIATSGVVLSTVREAADKDYRITVLSDCCADRDDEVHHVLITKVFPRQADVLAMEEWTRV